MFGASNKRRRQRLRRKAQKRVLQKWDALCVKWGLYIRVSRPRENAKALRRALRDQKRPTIRLRERFKMSPTWAPVDACRAPKHQLTRSSKQVGSVLPLQSGSLSTYRLGFWTSSCPQLKTGGSYRSAFHKNRKFLGLSWRSDRKVRALLHSVTRNGVTSQELRTLKYVRKLYLSGNIRGAESIVARLSAYLFRVDQAKRRV